MSLNFTYIFSQSCLVKKLFQRNIVKMDIINIVENDGDYTTSWEILIIYYIIILYWDYTIKLSINNNIIFSYLLKI